ncbi:MAG: hypothetical protein HY753_07120 [Nitrospirae bacterium]|nr:hypothetical protein [Nitrospirota bacterium]
MIKLVALLIIFFIGGCGTPMAQRSAKGHYYILDSKKAHEDEERHKMEIEARRENFIIEHPELSKAAKNLIRCGVLKKGMSKEFVLMMYGEPTYVENTNSGEEKWTYGYNPFKSYMYFKDGKLTSTWPGQLKYEKLWNDVDGIKIEESESKSSN